MITGGRRARHDPRIEGLHAHYGKSHVLQGVSIHVEATASS